MAHYFVGDVQGCYSELMRLLERVNFDPKQDKLISVGDLVARGSESKQVAKLVLELGDSIEMTLGNHDLHLMSIHAGLFSAKKNDLLTALLDADFIDDYILWLRNQPLIRYYPTHHLIAVHAGLHPDLSLKLQLSLAQAAQTKLSSANYKSWLKKMYGNEPKYFSGALSDSEKFRFIINVTTRMRYLDKDGNLEFKSKMPISDAPESLQPWFNFNPIEIDINQPKVIFGHWASLHGNTGLNNYYALDTGCVWGSELTLYCADNQQFYRQSKL